MRAGYAGHSFATVLHIPLALLKNEELIGEVRFERTAPATTRKPSGTTIDLQRLRKARRYGTLDPGRTN